MKLTIENIAFPITCEECQFLDTKEVYKVTTYEFISFGKPPRAIVTRMCKVCFNDKYPEHEETPENQMDLFDG